ncbi:MAG: sulfate reduction electron transfer complex DsrMKJOP subunit DsrM [Proteobacteria bacterium]|nr:sulfate reduction electron transfer complex DsrMKJOP subunit DsrM [Pseudomonadota bacterium]
MKIFYAFLAIILLLFIAYTGVEVFGFYLIFGVVIPYIAFAVFIFGTIYRIIRWAKTPVPFCVPTICGQQKSLPWIKANNIESPFNTAGVIGRMALEVLFFRSLFRNDHVELKGKGKLIYYENKFLWLGGLLFHWSLLFILLRHLRFFTEPVPSSILFLQNIDGIFQFGIPALLITDTLILIALTYLFLRRVVNPQTRYISLPSDYFAILLIAGIVITGILMRYFFKVDLLEVKKMSMGLVGFHPVAATGIGLTFYLHLFLVSTLLVYLPFGKIAHMAGAFFSPTRNLMNNSRMARHINPWNYPVKVHTYAEWEDEFRNAMKEVGLTVEKE